MRKILERQMNKILSEQDRKPSVGSTRVTKIFAEPTQVPASLGAAHSHSEHKPATHKLSPVCSKGPPVFLIAFAEWLEDYVFCPLWGLFFTSTAQLRHDERTAKASMLVFVFPIIFNLKVYNSQDIKRNFIHKSKPKAEIRHGHFWYTDGRGQLEELGLLILLNN